MTDYISFNYVKNNVLWIVCCVGLALSLIAALHPQTRSSLRSSIYHPYRTVLSTVTGDLKGNGNYIKVVKIKTENGIYLEVYASPQNDVRTLIDSIKLPDSEDGFFHFQGQATNLVLDDLDRDGTLEILAPSYDDKMVAHLNVYRYDVGTDRFILSHGLNIR